MLLKWKIHITIPQGECCNHARENATRQITEESLEANLSHTELLRLVINRTWEVTNLEWAVVGNLTKMVLSKKQNSFHIFSI